MRNLSTYHLIYELLSEGKGKLYPDLEPIDVQKILDELESRHGVSFVDLSEYGNWFISSDEGTASERSSVETMLRIKDIESKALNKLSDQSDEKPE